MVSWLVLHFRIFYHCQMQVQGYMEAALGVEQFSAMQAALTVPPLHTCVRVNTLRTTPQVGSLDLPHQNPAQAVTLWLCCCVGQFHLCAVHATGWQQAACFAFVLVPGVHAASPWQVTWHMHQFVTSHGLR